MPQVKTPQAWPSPTKQLSKPLVKVRSPGPNPLLFLFSIPTELVLELLQLFTVLAQLHLQVVLARLQLPLHCLHLAGDISQPPTQLLILMLQEPEAQGSKALLSKCPRLQVSCQHLTHSRILRAGATPQAARVFLRYSCGTGDWNGSCFQFNSTPPKCMCVLEGWERTAISPHRPL